MGPPTTKDDLLRFQREGRERWQALLARVPAARVDEPGVKGPLSVKDIVAHLAAWERHAAERLAQLARGEAPAPLPPPGTTWSEFEHAFNAHVYGTWHPRTWEDVTMEAREAYEAFIRAAEGLSDDVLFAARQPAWQTVAFNGYLHYEYFDGYLRDWLGRTGV